MSNRSATLRLSAIVAFALIISLAVACSGDSKSSTTPTINPDATGPDACALLSNDDLQPIIGSPRDSSPNNSAPYFECDWDSQDYNYTVNLTVYYDTPDNASAYFEQASGDAVDGLGDKAKWSAATHDLKVLKGQYSLTVKVISSYTDFDEETAARDLATKALSHLPS